MTASQISGTRKRTKKPGMRFAAFTTVTASAGEATDAAGFPDNLRQQAIPAEKLHELRQVCNLGYLLVEFAHSGLSQRQILRNLENFATKVMPRFAN